MKNMLMRPTSALFPAVLLAAGLMGNAYNAGGLFMAYLAIQLFSLCSIDSFRNAAAREPGVRRVDKRFSGTWPMILLGIAVTAGLGWFLSDKTEFLNAELWAVIAGGCIIIEQMFEERMFALSRRTDGVVLSIISNALLLVGLLLDGSGGVSAPVEMTGFYTVCGAGIGALISIAANYIIEPMHAFSLVPRNIAFFPKAAVQCLLYPATPTVLSAILIYLEPQEGNLNDLLTMEYQYLFAGWILWRLSRTVCRRTYDESRKLNLLLVAVCAALIIGGLSMGSIMGYSACALIALLCAMIVYCAPSVRLYIGFVLLCAAWMCSSDPYDNLYLVSIACAVIAVILNMHKAFLRKV